MNFNLTQLFFEMACHSQNKVPIKTAWLTNRYTKMPMTKFVLLYSILRQWRCANGWLVMLSTLRRVLRAVSAARYKSDEVVKLLKLERVRELGLKAGKRPHLGLRQILATKLAISRWLAMQHSRAISPALCEILNHDGSLQIRWGDHGLSGWKSSK